MNLGDFGPSWSDLLGGLMIAMTLGIGVLIQMLRRSYAHVRAIDHAVNNAGEGEPTVREMVQGVVVALADRRASDARRDEKIEELGRDLHRADSRVERLAEDVGAVRGQLHEHIAFHRGVEAAKGQS